jgi:hypothetical protein
MDGVPGRRTSARLELELMRSGNHAVVHVGTLQAGLIIDAIGYVIVIATHCDRGRITWYGTYRSSNSETGRSSPDDNSTRAGTIIRIPTPVNGDGGATISPSSVSTFRPPDSSTSLRTFRSPITPRSSNRRTTLRPYCNGPPTRSFSGNATAGAFGDFSTARTAGIPASPLEAAPTEAASARIATTTEAATAESATTTAAASGVSLLHPNWETHQCCYQKGCQKES